MRESYCARADGPGRAVWIRVEDTGYGIDHEESEELFEPLTRYIQVSEERRELGLGGMGWA